MKTREQVLAGIRARTVCIDGRDRLRLAAFLPASDWPTIGVEATGEPPELEPWTAERVLEFLGNDIEFGFEKALNRRGISAACMYTVVKMWLWILDDPLGDEDDDDYTQYGLPLLKAAALKYGFPNPIGDDTGREQRYGIDG